MEGINLKKGLQVYFPGCKGGRYVEMTTLPQSCDICLEICEPQTSGNPEGL
jgi:hypothetical protein